MKKNTVAENSGYPMNINRYLAQKQYASRRGAEVLITQKKVRINGKIAILGNRVNEGDKVEVQAAAIKKDYVYYAYNKARGIVTHSPQGSEIDIKQEIQKLYRSGKSDVKNSIPADIAPVGRLDKDSEGLIILTNDGRITDKLLNPKFSHEKEYLVETKINLRSSFKEKMEAGVKIENEMTKPCKITVLGEKRFRIILTEGKKHQIRRMCVALFNEVKNLKRERIMNIKLGNLGSRQLRKIEGEELKTFLKNIGM
jgi:23S rRNA pseudouridine2604 synthase